MNLDDQSPDVVDHVCDLIQGCLESDHTSVSGALVTWRDVMTMPMTDGSGGTICFVTQRSRVVRHKAPLHALPENDDAFSLAYTGMFPVLP